MDSANILIPEQKEGAQKNFFHSVTAPDCDTADEYFLLAKSRLLDPGRWHSLAGSGTARFLLADGKGKILTRHAHRGDHIRIAIPGPEGSAEADGFDWVHIEQIIYDTEPDVDTERISMQVRPCAAPGTASDEVHHFFSDNSTSTFVVGRIQCLLSASVHGRNETPNTDTEAFKTKARNTFVATGAIAGLASLQWNALLKGLLTFEE